jgi:hypothetical protein
MQVVQDSTAELYVFQVLEAKDDFNSKFTSASKVTTGGLEYLQAVDPLLGITF